MIGSTLGKYEVLEEVGHGGMSVVYLARDMDLQRDVAVKVLHAHLANRPDYRARFHREARAVARLSHPSIPEIYDFSADASDLAYLVTEYIPGPNLRDFVEEHPLDAPELGALVCACVADALQHAHEHGVIHRDVKPENVMIGPGGVLKLTDFGIAHIEDVQGLTATGTLLGSPAHMAPEHIEGKPLDQRADVFALGTVLYWLVTGALPFDAPNPQALFRTILDGSYTPAVRARPAVGEVLSGVIDGALRRAPEDRYESADVLRQALLEAVRDPGLVDEPEALVARWTERPEECQSEVNDQVLESLVARARRLVREGRKAMALRCYDRVLALSPVDADISVEVESLLRQNRRVRVVRRGVLVAAGLALVVAAALGLASLPGTPEPGPDPEALVSTALGEGEPPAPETPAEAAPRQARSTEGTPAPKAPGTAAGAGAPQTDPPSAGRVPHRRPKEGSARPHAGPSGSRTPPRGKDVRIASATGLPRQAAAPKPAVLAIRAWPYADVFVDGRRVAKHPPEKQIELMPGHRVVRFEKPGNRPKQFELDVPPDGGTLPPLVFRWPAIIRVEGAPGHFLQVEGRDLGTTDQPREYPMTRQVVPRARVVVLDPSRALAKEVTVTLRAGGETKIAVR